MQGGLLRVGAPGPSDARLLVASLSSSCASRVRAAPRTCRGPAVLRSPCTSPARHTVVAAAGRDVSATPWSGLPSFPGPKDPNKPAPPAIRGSGGGGGGGGGGGDGPALDLSSGLATLIALNAAVFAGAAFAKLPPLAALALYNSGGAWWQYATSAFVHANLAHLSRNMFLLWLWGSVLRREVTGPGVWFTYVLCGLAANLTAASALGAKAASSTALLGVAASGGCAGVALAALVLTARPSVRWLMGAALAVQFTLPALLSAPVPYAPAAAGNAAAAGATALARLFPAWALGPGAEQAAYAGAGGSGLAAFVEAMRSPSMSWLWGAAAGAILVVLLARLPVPAE